MVYAHHADTVTAYSTNGTCDVRTVRVIINRIGISVCSIDTIYIVDISVTVVINAVSWYFAWVHPCIVSDIFMGVINTRIYYADHHVTVTGGDIPRFWRINIHVVSTAGLACIV